MLLSLFILILSVVIFRPPALVAGVPLHSGPTTDVNLTAIAWNSTVVNITGNFLHEKEEDVSDVDFQKSVHLSVALAGMVLLLCFELHIRQQGYKLSRSIRRSTDDWMWIGMGVVSTVWTAIIFVSAWAWEEDHSNPCRDDPNSGHCAGRLAFAPWILVGVFLWWSLRLVGQKLWRRKNTSEECHHHTERKDRGCLMRIFRAEAWKKYGEPILVFLVVGAPVGWTTAGAFRSHLYTLGFLSAAALVFLGYALFDFDYYLNLPHHYAMDDVRCALLTPIEKGLVYVLPSRGYGFGAVYCPRLQSEQAVLEENRAWLEPLDMVKDDPNNNWTIGKCRAALRRILLSRTQKVELDEDIIKDLAYWLYWHRRDFEPLDTATTSVSAVFNTDTTPTAEEDNPNVTLSSSTECQTDNHGVTAATSTEPSTTPNATENDRKLGPRRRLERELNNGKVSLLTKRERLWYRLQTDEKSAQALKDIVRDRFPDLHPRDCCRRHNNDLREDCNNDKLPKDLESQRPKEVSADVPPPPLLGRDVVMALVQWEYLVFEWRWKLDEAMRADIWRLRSPKYGGAGFADPFPLPPQSGKTTMGSQKGHLGFMDAVGEVYRLLAGADPTTIQDRKKARDKKNVKEEKKVEDEKEMLQKIVTVGQEEVKEVLKLRNIQDMASHLQQHSVARPWTDKTLADPDNFTIEIYVDEVWDKCWAECPSTFGALYLWLTVWYVDVGNEGFHTTPLVPPGPPSDWDYDGPDYMSVWRMGWRHAWHVAIICQLVIMLPTIISTFFAILTFA